MKLIDKLFKKLGYIRALDALIKFTLLKKKYDNLVDEILSDEGLYFLIEKDNYFLILRQVQGSEHLISIKRFYYGDYGDDRDYALLCAKELLDELKKEI